MTEPRNNTDGTISTKDITDSTISAKNSTYITISARNSTYSTISAKNSTYSTISAKRSTDSAPFPIFTPYIEQALGKKLDFFQSYGKTHFRQPRNQVKIAQNQDRMVTYCNF